MTICSGGHPLPLHLPRGGTVTPVGATGSLVGVLDKLDLSDVVVRLAPGDLVVLYTDGVTEGRRGSEFYGEQRLRHSILEHADTPLPAESILGSVLAFQQGRARDDIAVVAVRVPLEPIGQETAT
jgi:sigma-B regulation protein RsbU (phosphoserine phosphatase)